MSYVMSNGIVSNNGYKYPNIHFIGGTPTFDWEISPSLKPSLLDKMFEDAQKDERKQAVQQEII